MYSHEKFRRRLDELFADVERLTADPAGRTSAGRKALDEMRTRLAQLEAEFTEIKHSAAEPQVPTPAAAIVDPNPVVPQTGNARHVTPLLYEKEQVGYAFTGLAVQPLQDTGPQVSGGTDAITAPLTMGGEVIGRMQIEPPVEKPLSAEEVSLLNAVAQQASVQIQNLRLLEATERARSEAEAATRRFIHESWDSYLDGIQHHERVGYVYDQSGIAPYEEKDHPADGIQESVKVMEEQVGTLYIKHDPTRPLVEEDKEMIATVAQRIAQQVENIRLLADASRARAEAEEATRLLTREGWRSFVNQQDRDLRFMYNSGQVVPMQAGNMPDIPVRSLPLVVRGEPIGELGIGGKDSMSEAELDMVAQIASKVSTQIENLRLSASNEKRASELATVATVSTTASTVLDPDKLLQQVVDLTKERFGLYHVHIYLADDDWHTLMLAVGAGETGKQMVEFGHAIMMDAEKSLVARSARERVPLIANDVKNEPDFLPNPLLPNTRSEMAVPMIVGEKVLGVLDVQSEVVGRFTEEDTTIMTTLALQVGIALQNARLYVAQTATVAQLRELDRLKSSFLANMSHELRTPLNSILGFADVILEELDGPLTENMNNDLKLIQKNGQHLLHLINDVLDMAKIESGRMNLAIEKFPLTEIIEEVTSITSPLASEKNLALFIEPGSDRELEISADRTRLRQVMINLVNNAIKFTEKGRIAIHAARDGEDVLIRIKDTGIGIPPEQLESVFQEFVQVDTSTTRKVGGTGLGLPISRKLIEMHGGRLWAESTGVNGEGSTFYVLLPIEARVRKDDKEIAKN
jgi:signal transduction histidine kinase